MSGAELPRFRRVVRAVRPFLIGMFVASVASILYSPTLRAGLTAWSILGIISLLLLLHATLLINNLSRCGKWAESSYPEWKLRLMKLLPWCLLLIWYLNLNAIAPMGLGPDPATIFSFLALGLSLLLLSLASVITIVIYLRHKRTERKRSIRFLLLFLSSLLIAWALSVMLVALLIYSVIETQHIKRAVQAAVFFLSTGMSILYFLYNRHRFPSVADKVTYFTGVCLGPPAVIQILL